jgi:hypothetical protein
VPQAIDTATNSVIIQFNDRARPKSFQLEDAMACKVVRAQLSELVRNIDGSGSALRPPGSSPDAREPRAFNHDGEQAKMTRGSHEGRRSHEHSPGLDSDDDDDDRQHADHRQPPPPWLAAVLGASESSECATVAHSRLLSGWCCRHMPLEAFLFGVLMPIALVGYFRTGFTAVEAEVDGKIWLEARCTLNDLVLEPRMIYHHGKFHDAKNKAYQVRSHEIAPAGLASCGSAHTAP